VRSTPDPALSLSQFLAEQHQCRLYAFNVRLGPGRSTLALGLGRRQVQEVARQDACWRSPSTRPPVAVTEALSPSPLGGGTLGPIQHSQVRSSSPAGSELTRRVRVVKNQTRAARLPNPAFDPGPRSNHPPLVRRSFPIHSSPPVLRLLRGRSTSALGTIGAPTHRGAKGGGSQVHVALPSCALVSPLLRRPVEGTIIRSSRRATCNASMPAQP